MLRKEDKVALIGKSKTISCWIYIEPKLDEWLLQICLITVKNRGVLKTAMRLQSLSNLKWLTERTIKGFWVK